MKKQVIVSCLIVSLLLIIAVSASALTIGEGNTALREAETFDQQLRIVCELADENADALEAGGWDYNLQPNAAAGYPEGLIPADWDSFDADKVETFPDELRGHKLIALYTGGKDDLDLAAWLMARFPADMRAASLEEAEYAVLIRAYWTDSGYQYIPPASSSHRDYAGFVLDLKNGGKAKRFWFHRNYAKRSGKWGQLSGDNMSNSEMWSEMRSQFWGEIRYEVGDESVLIIGISGKNAFVKDYDGISPVVEVPAEAEGHPVIEIAANAFKGDSILESIILPEGLRIISQDAFNDSSLKEIVLPSTLETIASSAFYSCDDLASVKFPEGIKRINAMAFNSNRSLTDVTLPASLTSIGERLFQSSSKLARAVVEEGITSLSQAVFDNCVKLACVYLPASLNSDTGLSSINEHAVIYTPEGSFAYQWAQEIGYQVIACEKPDDMPKAEYITEGEFEFRIFNGEAAVNECSPSNAVIVVPETAGGCPVTAILSSAIYREGRIINLPPSVTLICRSGILLSDNKMAGEIYIPNPDTVIEKNGIGRYGTDKTRITIYAPEGSLAQRYAVDNAESNHTEFEPWGEGVDMNARSLANAVKIADKLLQNATEFWNSCDQSEYSWLGRIPDYEADHPKLAAVLRFPQSQYNDLALLMTGPENVAKTFSVIVNTQWNLPYAKASVQTAQTDQFDLVPDGNCAIIVLAYRSDLVFVTLQNDGSAQAALVFCSPADIAGLDAETVQKIAAQYGVTGECTVYDQAAVKELLAK